MGNASVPVTRLRSELVSLPFLLHMLLLRIRTVFLSPTLAVDKVRGIAVNSILLHLHSYDEWTTIFEEYREGKIPMSHATFSKAKPTMIPLKKKIYPCESITNLV